MNIGILSSIGLSITAILVNIIPKVVDSKNSSYIKEVYINDVTVGDQPYLTPTDRHFDIAFKVCMKDKLETEDDTEGNCKSQSFFIAPTVAKLELFLYDKSGYYYRMDRSATIQPRIIANQFCVNNLKNIVDRAYCLEKIEFGLSRFFYDSVGNPYHVSDNTINQVKELNKLYCNQEFQSNLDYCMAEIDKINELYKGYIYNNATDLLYRQRS